MCCTQVSARFAPVVLLLLTAGWFSPASRGQAPAKAGPVQRLTGHTGEVYTVTFSPDGQRLASASNTHVKVWDAATGKEVFTVPTKGTNVFGLAYSPDSKRLAVGVNKQIKLLDADGKETAALGGTNQYLFRLAFDRDGKHVAAAAGDNSNTTPGAALIWEVASGRMVHCLQGHANAVLNLAYSDDGRHLATVSGLTSGSRASDIKVWDARAWREVLTLPGHPDNIYGVAFSPDGRRLASASGTKGATKPGEVRIWELASSKEGFRLAGHTGPVFAVVFSPDGRRLATASGDKTIKLWDAITGKEILTLADHTQPVYSLAFSPDGKRLASASGDRQVKVWDVSGGTAPVAQGPLAGKELETLWTDLTGADVSKVFRGIGRLAAAPTQSVPFLQDRLRPEPRLSVEQEKNVARMLHELDNPKFDVRHKATLQLAQLGEAAVSALQQTLAGKPSLEVRWRAQRLLDDMVEQAPTGDRLAALRAVEVLERAGTPEAVVILKKLADGLPSARLTQEARATLERLERRAAAP